MIYVNGVANPAGNRRIEAVGEMAIAKILKRGFVINKMKAPVVQAFFQNL
ncbi:MAG TPA: hypothetical protein VJ111_11930 [Chitinophagaceae bacterium]|nr:hypothetical protein [Chitinophagaceae bacterium]